MLFFKKNILHHPLNFKSEQNFDNFVHSLFEVIHAHPYPNIPQLFYPSSDILMKKYRYDDGKIFCKFCSHFWANGNSLHWMESRWTDLSSSHTWSLLNNELHYSHLAPLSVYEVCTFKAGNETLRVAKQSPLRK